MVFLFLPFSIQCMKFACYVNTHTHMYTIYCFEYLRQRQATNTQLDVCIREFWFRLYSTPSLQLGNLDYVFIECGFIHTVSKSIENCCTRHSTTSVMFIKLRSVLFYFGSNNNRRVRYVCVCVIAYARVYSIHFQTNEYLHSLCQMVFGLETQPLSYSKCNASLWN